MSDVNIGRDTEQRSQDQQLQALPQTPHDIMRAWVELWRGYTATTVATLNLMQRAAEDLKSAQDRQQRENIAR